ncbi:MAG: hypothetical protein ACTSUV_00095 [Candidatus Ranarchaeia archaeon]
MIANQNISEIIKLPFINDRVVINSQHPNEDLREIAYLATLLKLRLESVLGYSDVVILGKEESKTMILEPQDECLSVYKTESSDQRNII